MVGQEWLVLEPEALEKRDKEERREEKEAGEIRMDLTFSVRFSYVYTQIEKFLLTL